MLFKVENRLRSYYPQTHLIVKLNVNHSHYYYYKTPPNPVDYLFWVATDKGRIAARKY